MRSGAVGVMMHLARAVPVMVAPERGSLWKGRRGGARGGSWAPALLVYLLMAPWSRGIWVGPQATRLSISPCTPAPALGRRGAAHSDPAVARSACALLPSSCHTRVILSCDLPFISPLPGSGALRMRASARRHPPEHLVLLRVSAHLAHRVGWRRESSGTSALRWVLVLTRGSGSLSIFRAILYCISFFCSILYSRLLFPPTLSPSSTPLDSLTTTLQLDRSRAPNQ
jgi:hypothetical protein